VRQCRGCGAFRVDFIRSASAAASSSGLALVASLRCASLASREISEARSERFSEARLVAVRRRIVEGLGSWKAAIRELSTKKTLLSLVVIARDKARLIAADDDAGPREVVEEDLRLSSRVAG